MSIKKLILMSFFSRNLDNKTKRRITPRRTDSPTMSGFLPRNNTPVPKNSIEDIDTDVYSDVETEEYSDRIGSEDESFIGFGVNGSKRPPLFTLDDDNDLFSDDEEIGRKKKVIIRQKAVVVPKVGGARKVVKAAAPPVAAKAPAKRIDNRAAQAKLHCFTWNNPTMDGEELAEALEALEKDGETIVSGYVFQLEAGENGTPHFQGCIELKVKARWSAIVDAFPDNAGVYHENTKGDKIVNKKYCTKEEGRLEGPWCFGTFETMIAGHGRRTDYHEFAERVLKEGITQEHLEENPGMFIKYAKAAEWLSVKARRFRANERMKAFWKEQWRRKEAGEDYEMLSPVNVVLLVGPSAVGKSTLAMMELMGKHEWDTFKKAGGHQWYCGIDADTKAILIDEARGKTFNNEIELFNEITNKCPVELQVKGSTALVELEAVWLTSNRMPCDWFKEGDREVDWSDARYRAMVRRFAEVRWWNDAKELTVLKNPGIEQDTDDWRTANDQWVRFWRWKSRAIMMGEANVDGPSTYFTLP